MSITFICARCGVESSIADKNITRIGVMRHGKTGLNEKGVIIGSIDDPLDNDGRKQATDAAQQLKDIDRGYDAVVSSAQLRSAETAEIIAKTLTIPVYQDIRLNERGTGVTEGTPVFSGMLAQFLQDSPVVGIEPLEQFEKRVMDAFMEIREKYRTKSILFVTSALPMLTIIKFIKGWQKNLDKLLSFGVPPNCSVIEFFDVTPCSRCNGTFFERRATHISQL